jgi:hypothetical protein
VLIHLKSFSARAGYVIISQLLFIGCEANFSLQYGRSFTLTDPGCNTPNGICKFSGGADAGPCSATSGILTYQEIQDIISDNNLTPVHDQKAGVKWITWNNNQWISYDDDDTFEQKKVSLPLSHHRP